MSKSRILNKPFSFESERGKRISSNDDAMHSSSSPRCRDFKMHTLVHSDLSRSGLHDALSSFPDRGTAPPAPDVFRRLLAVSRISETLIFLRLHSFIFLRTKAEPRPIVRERSQIGWVFRRKNRSRFTLGKNGTDPQKIRLVRHGSKRFKKPPCIMRCASDFEMTCKKGSTT